MTQRGLFVGISLIVGVLIAARLAHAKLVAEHQPPSSATSGQPLTLSVFVYEDNPAVSQKTQYTAVVYYDFDPNTGQPQKSQQATIYTVAGEIDVTIPGGDIIQPELSYYIVVREARYKLYAGVPLWGWQITDTRLPESGVYDVPVTS